MDHVMLDISVLVEPSCQTLFLSHMEIFVPPVIFAHKAQPRHLNALLGRLIIKQKQPSQLIVHLVHQENIAKVMDASILMVNVTQAGTVRKQHTRHVLYLI
jgi:hypothetical protein